MYIGYGPWIRAETYSQSKSNMSPTGSKLSSASPSINDEECPSRYNPMVSSPASVRWGDSGSCSIGSQSNFRKLDG